MLETSLGIRLLHRSTRRVAVTDAGERVLPGVTQPANVWAVYPARLAQSAKVRACVNFLKETLGG